MRCTPRAFHIASKQRGVKEEDVARLARTGSSRMTVMMSRRKYHQ
jgi:hypothetical protein